MFSHYLFSKPISFESSSVNMLVFENPLDMGKMILELSNQMGGSQGSFILSENNKELDIHKSVILVVDPFALDCNSKEILSGFYQEVSKNIELGEDYVKMRDVIGELMEVLIDAASSLEPDSDYSEPEVIPLLKSLSLGFLKTGSFSEDLCNYVRLVSRYTSKRLIILVKVGDYLSEEEYRGIVSYCHYLQFPILLIESQNRDAGVPVRIYDYDFCELDM